jgi:hypothetical protein
VVFAAPLFIRDEFSGLIVVAVPSGHIRAATDGLEALTSQVSLAVESAALTQDVLLAAEREALRVPGAERLGHRHRHRARHHDPLREPGLDARPGLRPP